MKKVWSLLTATVLAVTVPLMGTAASSSAKSVATPSPRVPIQADLNHNKVFDNLEQTLLTKGPVDRVPVIVMLNEANTDQRMNELRSHVGTFQVKRSYHYAIQGFSADLTKGQIQAVQKLPFVKQIEADLPVHTTLDSANKWFGTAQARADFGVTGDRDGNPKSYSKTDVVVGIIDTGIDATHVDLDGGKVIAFKDFVKGKTTAYDDNGHGTHVSSIVAGEGDANPAYKGVAPGAALVGIKVLDRRGSGAMSDVTAGIDWAVQNKDVYGIRVLNLSLGTSSSSDGTDSTSVAVNNAVANGIVVAVAAGNSGPDKYTIGSPGAAKDALTVGALADVGEMGFHITDFSSRGPTADGRIKPDIMAPGYNITAAKANSTNGYVTYSGTSMATPFTAGTVALMLDANYSLSPADVRYDIIGTAQDWGPAGQDIDYGYGRLQGYEAVKAAGKYTGTSPAVPNHTAVVDSLTSGGASKTYSMGVTSATLPVAVTMIIRDWTSGLLGGSPDFDLYVYDPSGALVGSSEGTTRHEQVTFTPTTTGTYTVEVYSYSGSGTFLLDESYK